jgi:ABC-2 type transport system ATP-binding protein
MTRRPVLAAATASLLLAGLAVAAPSSAAPAPVHACFDSVPEPNSDEPVSVCYTLFQPEGASADSPVPMLLHGHGWGGSRDRTPSPDRQRFLDAGYGVLSFDQRGFGESGGRAHTLQADIEAHDVLALVDVAAGLDWVAQDAPGDPVLGAIGGSYGGGFQYLGAFGDLLHNGSNRFDALAPEITWNDLKDSLAPEEVARSVWLAALSAVSVNDNDERAQRAFAYGSATGLWASGPAAQAIDADMDAYFLQTGPKWHVSQGRQLDIPVLMRQGISDNLFNLNQAVTNFDTALTPAAREQSALIGYNGGHVLPNALPRAAATGGDPCSTELHGGDFVDLTIAFFDRALKGEGDGVRGTGQYHLATSDATDCLNVDTAAPSDTVQLGTLVTPVAAGAPLYVELTDGAAVTVAGVPQVQAAVTSAGLHNKAFFALAVGTSPTNAVVLQNNVMPLHEPLPVVDAQRTIELPGVAANVPAGQKLFLVVSPVSDMFAANGSRTPGGIVLEDVRVQLPRVAQQADIAPAPGPAAPAEDGTRGNNGGKGQGQDKGKGPNRP